MTLELLGSTVWRCLTRRTSSIALKGALICGEGLMLSGDVMMKPYAEQNLVRRVMPGWIGPEYEFNAVFPRGQMQSQKVRASVDFLVERLNFDADYMQELCEDSPIRCPQMLAALDARAAASHPPATVTREPTPAAIDVLAEPA